LLDCSIARLLDCLMARLFDGPRGVDSAQANALERAFLPKAVQA